MGGIEIPAARVETVANETASSAKSVAAVFIVLLILVVLGGIGAASSGQSKQDGSSLVIGISFWLLILGGIASHFLRNASRASASAKRAKAEPASQWFLCDRMIVGLDAKGASRSEWSFKISNKNRTALTAVPAAKIVERS